MRSVNGLVVAAVAASGLWFAPAVAADLTRVPVKASPPPAFEPWDVAFGAGIMNDYVFRGVTQSNHRPSVTAYFEPRYNINKDLQLYVGTSVESISFTNRAAAEVDIYGGIRPTFGALALDLGVWGYLYPGGRCFDNGGIVGLSTVCPDANVNLAGPAFNVMKKDVSFYEVYAKANYTVSDAVVLGGNVFYSPNFLNTGADGLYASATAKLTAPADWLPSGIGSYVSGEFGRQWLGTSDAFYGVPAFPNGIKYADYNTWNIGVGFTYKVVTLDLRYSDTNLSKGDCNAFTSDFTATQTGSVTPINPGGFGSNWCGATGIARLSVDLTAMNNLK